MSYMISADYITGIIPNNAGKNPYFYRKRVNLLDDLAYNAAESEQALWRAVISQAISDALASNLKDDVLHYKEEAMMWFLGGGEDFCDVCERAGLEPYYVRKKAKRAMIAPPCLRIDAGASTEYRRKKRLRRLQKRLARHTLKEWRQQAKRGCLIHLYA